MRGRQLSQYSKGRSECHVTFIGSSEGSVEGEKHRDKKSVDRNFQEIKVEESNEPIALK